MKKSLFVPVLSLALSTSVVLNGVHAKDLAGIQSVADSNQKVEVAQNAKVGADLHPHVDKHFSKTFSDTPQVDNRSLRLRESKKQSVNSVRDWLDAMREQFALYLG